MKARKACYWFALILFLFPVYCSATSQPTDSVALWEGEKMHHGKQVMLYTYQPEHPNGISVIVCPGGSYHWLDREVEGFKVGEWLSENGITAFVLLYRTAGYVEVAMPVRLVFRGKRHPDMIMDAQRALQYVGEHAEEYGIDPDGRYFDRCKPASRLCRAGLSGRDDGSALCSQAFQAGASGR